MSGHLSEFELIETLFAPLAMAPGAFGLKDDVAVIAPRRGCELVVTTDAIVAGIDFFQSDPAPAVAKKALRVNLSDLVAKGAEPFGYLLTLLIPEEIGVSYFKEFCEGLTEDQSRFGVSLAWWRHEFDAGSVGDFGHGFRSRSDGAVGSA